MSKGYERDKWVIKFGRCADVDSGEVVDIYDNGDVVGNYPWPASALETSIVSDSAADTAAGTGARTVTVQGLDANYMLINQTASLSGATPVALPEPMLRVFRVRVSSAGSEGTNAGTIDIKHGSTVIAQVTAGFGQTLMAVYTVPAGQTMYLAGWHANIKISNNGTQAFRIDVRPFGGAWNCKETFELGGTSGADFARKFAGWQAISAKSDIRIRAFGGSDNNTVVSAGFDLLKSR